MTKKLKLNNKYQKGIALVEVIAALGIAVVVITSLVALSISTLRSSLNSKLLLEGSKVANGQLELVRAYRDSNDWTTFITAMSSCKTGSVCHMTNGTVVPGTATQGNGTELVTISFVAQNPSTSNPVTSADTIARILVSVTWKIGSAAKGAYIQTDLTNWRNQ